MNQTRWPTNIFDTIDIALNTLCKVELKEPINNKVLVEG